MLTVASCLSTDHEVTLFWDDPNVLIQAQHRFGLRLDNVTVKKNIFSLQNSLMKRLSKSYDYDVIIYLSDGSIPVLAAKKTILHFQFPVEWVESKTLLTRLKLKNVYRTICNSQFTKDFIDKKFDINSSIIYPPIKRFQSDAMKAKDNTILTVGRFSLLPNGTDYKKQIFLIDAFKKMVDGGIKDWRLVVVTSFFSGGENGTTMLQAHAKGYPIDIKANITKDEMEELYDKAAIYWHATGYGEDLRAHPDWAEHFGITTVEAMGAGCIPVVINAGGQREIVQDGENGMLWDNEEELLKKTKKLIKDPALLSKLRSDPAQIEKKYGVERFCREIHKAIL